MIIGLLLVRSATLIPHWRSPLSFWGKAYEIEATPQNTVNYGVLLMNSGRVEEALPLAMQVMEWDPKRPDLPLFFAQTVYRHPRMSDEFKMRLMAPLAEKHFWYAYYIALIESKQGKDREAFAVLEPYLKGDLAFAREIKNEISRLAEEILNLCRRSGAAGKAECRDHSERLVRAAQEPRR